MTFGSESRPLARATGVGIALLAVLIFAAASHWSAFLELLPYGKLRGTSAYEQQLYTALFWGRSFIVTILFAGLYWVMPSHYRPDIGWRWPKWWWYPIAVASSLLLMYASTFIVKELVAAGFPYKSAVGVFLNAPPAIAALAFLNLGFVSPIVQELVFRGWLFSGLTRALPVVWAALISAALFSFVHTISGVPALAFAFLWGLSTAVLFRYSRSIVPPAIAHVVNNAIASLILLHHR